MPRQKQNRREILESGLAAAAGMFAALLPSLVGAQPGPPAPIVLAVTDFMGGTPGDRRTAHKISRIIASDLKHSGRFVLVDSSIAERVSVGTQLRFGDWIALKVQGLITGHIVNRRHKLRSEIRLWDVVEGKQLMGKSYVSGSQGWRRVAHSMAASIYEKLTGEKMHFED